MKQIFYQITIFNLLISSSFVWAQSLKILSYNVYLKPEIPFLSKSTYGSKRIIALCSELKKTNYDVIFLQELWQAKHRKMIKHCGYPFTLDISKSTLGTTKWKSKPEGSLSSGLMILSKHPFTQWKRMNYNQRGDWFRIFNDGEFLVRKAAYIAQIRHSSGEKFWLANTHLVANYCDHFPYRKCNSYEKVRRAQIKQLSGAIIPLTSPTIFGGDLNMGPQLIARDSIWDHLETYYFPGFKQANYDPSTTSTYSLKNLFNKHEVGKIDHLFGSQNLIASDGKIAFDKTYPIAGKKMNLSDHFGWESIFTKRAQPSIARVGN